MRLLLAAAMLCITTILLSADVQAHVLKTDGSIGAILHIKPDDNPKSDTPTDYSLSFSDTTKKFSLPTCICTLTLESEGKPVFTQKIRTSTDTIGINTITFPKNGIYRLMVNGEPTLGNNFQSFSLTYTVRVGNQKDERNQAQPIPPLLWLGIAGASGLMLLGATRLKE